MIENLLLDPETIWEAIQSVVEKTPFKSARDVASGLDGILDDLESAEIDRRCISRIGYATFRPKAPTSDLASQVAAFQSEMAERFSPAALQEAAAQSAADVETIKRENRRRELYHGKAALECFYKNYLHSTGLSKEVFRYELARHARSRKSVTTFFDGFLSKLNVTN